MMISDVFGTMLKATHWFWRIEKSENDEIPVLHLV